MSKELISKAENLDLALSVNQTKDGFQANANATIFEHTEKGPVVRKKIQTAVQGKSFEDAKEKVLVEVAGLLGLEA
jgi:hypothetical protein